ncbi:TonB-dependent receptor domain-containing protein [Pontimicrobium aquaticum]|uniref:TonB-dependent receptor n=1 Tax=Pontimicrobium aquaticum TaxID=2565367 RepID=A0A4U0EYA0_9FLAO|nr:TonB-dependent receptor [Pontimicrobium aquaticum]TJY37051.1 TonB-dependent receptor [Pontimicrobium aquaticum]
MKNVSMIIVFLFAQSMLAQISVKGSVLDNENKPISFANIAIFNTNDSTLVKGVISDDVGKFEIKLQREKSYLLKVSFLGFQQFEKNFNKSIDFGDIVLKPLAEQLNNVVVTAQKPLIQRQQDKLIVNVEGSTVSLGNSTLEILEKSPGIIVDQDGNMSLSGRNGVRVFMDGKDLRLQGDELANLLRSMPSSNIEKIEIITNPSAKYEAQGNAGIVNIVTKKGKLFGTNGNLTLTPGYGRHFRWENSININHRGEKFNVYGQYSLAKRTQWMKIDIDRAFLDEDDDIISSYKLKSLFDLPIEVHSPRFGVDFQPNKKTSYGIVLSSVINNSGSKAINKIKQYDGNGDLISNQLTDTDTDSKWRQLMTNFNIRHEFENKSVLDFDFDLAKYNNSSDQSYNSSFFTPEGEVSNADLLEGDVEGYLDLYGFSLDYELPISNKNKFEAGWKNTWVKTDNDLLYFNTVDGNTTQNNQLSNRFIYDEAIYGLYATYSINKEKYNAQIGLRGEYSVISGNQVTTNDTFDNQYFELFPSATFNYSLNENNVLGVSLSRRIDRPSYGQLNPFRFFVDTNSFRVGNPFLKPQFTWLSEINYTLNNKYYFAFSYGYTIDNLNAGILQDGEEQSIVVKPINIESLNSFALTFSAPFKLASWIQSNINLNASYNIYEGLVSGSQLNRSTPVVTINSSHSINLGNNFRIQLGTFNLLPHYTSITKIEHLSSVSLGAQKTVWDGKGIFRLNINDIFWNQYPVGSTNFGGLKDKFHSYRDNRFATFSFTWRFGKQTVRAQNRRRTGIQEELNRARQQNK